MAFVHVNMGCHSLNVSRKAHLNEVNTINMKTHYLLSETILGKAGALSPFQYKEQMNLIYSHSTNTFINFVLDVLSIY